MIDCVFPSPDPARYPPFAGPGAPLPDVSLQLYAVLAGPGALYPAEAPTSGEHCTGCGYVREHHEDGGRCPGLKTKTFVARQVVEQATWREVMRRDMVARNVAPAPYVPPVMLPPRIVARRPLHPPEFAAGQGKQAAGLGRKAVAEGWQVSAHYWLAGDGTEGCAVRLAKGVLRAVATWKRPAGMLGSMQGWSTDVAYAWRTDADRMPQKVTVTMLEGLLA